MKKLLFVFLGLFSASSTAQAADDPLLKVFDVACRSNPRNNIMLSPWGIQQCLGMLVGGAEKSAITQFETVLGLNMQNRKELREARLSLEKVKAGYNSFNAVLSDRKHILKKCFIQDVTHFFGGQHYCLDFARNEESAAFLNDIIKRESRNMFDNVFTPQDFSGDAAMILLNVLYFKNVWLDPFSKNSTCKERFMTPSASKFESIHHSQVDMMNDTKSVPYYNDGKFHGVILDYADERFKMLVLTTVKMSSSLGSVTRKLAQKGVQHFVRNSSCKNKTRIKLPKLQLGSAVDLKPLLSSMGLKEIFNPQKSTLSVSQEGDALYVKQIRQLVKLSLNESETEVAAITYAAPAPGARPSRKQITYNNFYADHPFVLVLFDSQTQAILLTAAVIHPESK